MAGKSDVKTTVSVDTSDAEKNLKKFGFSMDGVFTKLARQLSATDIAAAAVFAGIAKGQQVMAASIKAYEDQQRAIQKATGVVSPYLKAQADITAAIESNNIVLGESMSAWANWGQKVELSFSNLFTFLSTNAGKLELLAVLQGRSTLGAMLGRAYGQSGVNQYNNQKALTPWGGASGGGSSGAGDDNSDPGPKSPYTSGYADWRRNYGDGPSSRFGQLRGNLMGPGYGKLGPPMGGYKSGDTSDFSSDMMDELQKQREKYEASLQAEADMIERVNAQLDQFSYAIGSSLVNALFQGQNAVDALKNAVMDMVQSFLTQLASTGIKSLVGSFIPGFSELSGGGRTVGTAPSTQALSFYRNVVVPAEKYERRRGR